MPKGLICRLLSNLLVLPLSTCSAWGRTWAVFSAAVKSPTPCQKRRMTRAKLNVAFQKQWALTLNAGIRWTYVARDGEWGKNKRRMGWIKSSGCCLTCSSEIWQIWLSSLCWDPTSQLVFSFCYFSASFADVESSRCICAKLWSHIHQQRWKMSASDPVEMSQQKKAESCLWALHFA